MKKTLIALAAIAATASYAQSSVTLSGNFDFANANKSGTLANIKANTVTMGQGTSSTSTIKITAIEDLGGGLKVTGLYEIDPRTGLEDSLGVTHTANTTTSTNTSASVASTVTGLARGETYLGLSGGFGGIKLGAINAPGQDAMGNASPLGTGVGSGYQINAGTNSMAQSAFNVRYNRSVRYDSPNMNGFTFAIQHAPGGDQAASATSTALSVPNNRNVTEIGLGFATGALKLNFANIAQAKQTNATGWYSQGSATGLAATNTNIVSGSYAMGNITVYGTMWNGEGLLATTTAITVGGYRGAIKASFGNVDVIGQYTEARTNNGTETKGTTTGARLDYNLSKTSAAYLGYENSDNGASTANQLTIVSVGLRKSF